jgi:cell division protein FtsW
MRKEEELLKQLSKGLNSLNKVDGFFLQLTLALCILGLVFAFSSSIYESHRLTNNFWSLGLKQLFAFSIGSFLLFTLWKINYKFLFGITWQFAITMFVFMLLLFTPIGVTSGGSSRWIDLGFFQIQPAEITKLAVVLLISKFLTQYKWTDFKKYYYLIFSFILIGLVLGQPDLGSAGILIIMTLVLLFLFGYPIWILLPGCALAICGVIYKITSTPYQMSRINFWLRPELDPQGQGYNLIQAKYAFGLGGFFGAGLGNSIQKEVGHLPIPHADFIFAVISEEMGFLGATAILILYLAWILRAIYLVNQVQDKYGRILGSGIVYLITFQAVINLTVASGLIPVTGVTLPFFSCGGTSLMVTLAMVGILFNILSESNQKELQRKTSP